MQDKKENEIQIGTTANMCAYPTSLRLTDSNHLKCASQLIAAALLVFNTLLAIKKITIVTSAALCACLRTLDYCSDPRTDSRADVCTQIIMTASWTRHRWKTMIKK